jgi:hypothetical protein
MPSESLIAALLFEAEGAELDFKRDQYPFEGADDRTKSELLKDILAFANAWRRTDAYILIGVQEVKEAESIAVGINGHIDDAKLQQFINSKTNRPIEFSYTPMSFRGMQIGVIHIPVQDRPTFITKDYGALRRNTVYLRRGSSTDEARPDEIARMGQAVSENIKPKPILVPQLATGTDWSEHVEIATFEATHLKCPEIATLPDYSEPRSSGPYGIHIPTGHYANSSFYRDRAKHLQFRAKLRPIRFCVRNDGTALASGVKFSVQISDPAHSVELKLGSNRPEMPSREWSPIFSAKSMAEHHPIPDIDFVRTKAGWAITVHFGRVQAKDTLISSEELFLGIAESGSIQLSVSIFADELPSPISSNLILNFLVSEIELDRESLLK